MRLLRKTRAHTWWNGPDSPAQRADLDHAVATTNLEIEEGAGGEVGVEGWTELGTEREQGEWIGGYSDHAAIWMKVVG